jgi:hypothetical protein
MSKGESIPLPEGAPQAGEVYRHYKGDNYKIIGMAIHSGNDYSGKDEWMVIYEPMYENPAAPFFARPYNEWQEKVDWEGQQVLRFAKVS